MSRNLTEIEGVKSWAPHRKYMSAADEDKFIIEYFNSKKNGYLIDFGAADGVTGSNTFKLLDDLEWSGLLVEPSSYHKENLELLYNSIEDISICSKAIANTDFEIQYVEMQGGFIGHSNTKDYVHGSHNHKKYMVPAIKLPTLLKEYKIPHNIDFISMDMEGAEDFVMENWDFNTYKVKLWCIENGHRYKDLLEKHNYEKIIVDSSRFKIIDGNEFWELKDE